MRRTGGLGFLPGGGHETGETRFLADLDLSGKVVYDIGGFEGILTLFFARTARAVITYEPNPRSYARCVHNAALNGLDHVRVRNCALSSQPGELEMIYDPLMPGAASANPEISTQIKASVNAPRLIRAAVSTLDSDIEANKLPAPDFVKIDVEGMELDVLRGMPETLKKYAPALYIELHGAEREDKFENAKAVIGFLEQAGYRIYDVENRCYAMSSTLAPLPPSHLYCTITRPDKDGGPVARAGA